jgi:DNA-binding Lrp family transcriptional regulator
MSSQAIFLDTSDKEIIRCMYFSKSHLASKRIAEYVGLSCSSALSRLRKLEKLGIVKTARIQKIRSFQRKFKNKLSSVKSPRGIYWALDIKKE